jgi:hypothetical protein
LKTTLQSKPPAWEKPVTIGLYFALFIFLAGLGYLGYLLLAGRLSADAYPDAASLLKLNSSLGTALSLFALGLWLFVILGLVQWRNAGLFGWLLLGGGLVLYFAAPALFSLIPGIDLSGINSPARNLLIVFQQHGAGLLCLGALRIVFGVIWRPFAPPETSVAESTPAAAKGGAASMMRNCWELGFCKSVLKHHCPRFLKKITCWKAKSGCYCDDDLSRSLVVSARAIVEGEAPLEMQRSVQRARQSASFLASGRPSAGNPAACTSCPIYREHQRHKFRIVALLIYPLTGVILWLILPIVRNTWLAMEAWLGHIMGYAQFLPTGANSLANPVGTANIDFSWVAVVFAGAMLLSLFMRISEWLVLDKGW